MICFMFIYFMAMLSLQIIAKILFNFLNVSLFIQAIFLSHFMPSKDFLSFKCNVHFNNTSKYISYSFNKGKYRWGQLHRLPAMPKAYTHGTILHRFSHVLILTLLKIFHWNTSLWGLVYAISSKEAWLGTETSKQQCP